MGDCYLKIQEITKCGAGMDWGHLRSGFKKQAGPRVLIADVCVGEITIFETLGWNFSKHPALQSLARHVETVHVMCITLYLSQY